MNDSIQLNKYEIYNYVLFLKSIFELYFTAVIFFFIRICIYLCIHVFNID